MGIKSIEHRIEGTETSFVKAELYYDLGGLNTWSYKEEPRGYWVSVRRIKREGNLISFDAYDGRRFLIKEVKRNSKKAAEEAVEVFNNTYMELIKRVYPDVKLSSGCTIR